MLVVIFTPVAAGWSCHNGVSIKLRRMLSFVSTLWL